MSAIIRVSIGASILDDPGEETVRLGEFVYDSENKSTEFITNKRALTTEYSAAGAEFIFEYLEGQSHQMAEILKSKLKGNSDPRSFYEVMDPDNQEEDEHSHEDEKPHDDEKPHLENHFHEEWK